jgi:hypothetical protein
MVSSVLSPEKIVGRQNTNRVAAQNFISGGSILGASVVNGAANKIVGFQRAGVQPAPSAVGSIVSTISTNINNNVTSTINKTLQGFSADYQRRLKQVDDAKPIGILGKFLNVYKTALGFINFFGNKRNIDKVRNNLEALKKSFTESFEVAKLIRQVIIKIVKQLSNLPVASPSGGGGLNLDVDIPGGPLRKTAPRGLQRMMGGKGKMLALGAGALGLGALGAGTVNALSDSPQDQAQAAQTSPDIPGDVVDKFSSIVDKFANAISKLFETGKTKPKQQQPPGSSGGGGEKKPPGKTKPPGPTSGKLLPGDAAPEIKALMSTISGGEGGENSVQGIGEVKGLSNMTIDQSINTAKSYIGKGSTTGALGAFQFHSDYLRKRAIDAGLDPTKDKFNLENQTKIQRHFQTVVYGGNEEQLLKSLRSGGLQTDIFPKLSTNFGWPSLPGGSQPNVHTSGAAKRYEDFLKTYKGAPVAPVLPSQAQVAAAPTSTQARQQIAQQVAQPAATQQPVVMPINLGSGGQQQTGGGGTSGPPPSQGSGPSVPFLPAGNPDNFLVLYSRMVYNIVDG